jgi:hypothetical protein
MERSLSILHWKIYTCQNKVTNGKLINCNRCKPGHFRYWLCLSLTFYFCRFFSDEIIERIHEAGFRIAARKETTLSRDVAEEFREKKDTGIDLWTKVRLSPHKKRRNRSTYEGKENRSKF